MKTKLCWILVLFLCSAILFSHFFKGPWREFTPRQAYACTVLLLPLDSRPACTDFVTDLAAIANIKIISPPKELLGRYKTPADAKVLRAWFKENISSADAAIVSVDMLVHGGLMASRLSNGNEQDVTETLQLLKETHQNYPSLSLYAFNILPRLWLADNEDNKKYQKPILEYSKLKDQISIFENPADIKRMKELEKEIPADIRSQYLSLYQKNASVNKELIHLANEGVLEKFIIGQDDGQIFGIPNMVKLQLQHYADRNSTDPTKTIITRGTDEVALTLLGNLVTRLADYKPKIYVEYADAKAPGKVMPYMPHSVATTVKEKIHILNGVEVSSPEKADFLLYVYIGTEENQAQRFTAAKRIHSLLKQNYKIALVDLSEHFEAGETILPLLTGNQVPINRFIAYAGWNTTSNSIGTAVTQAGIFTVMNRQKSSTEDILNLYAHNIQFLVKRFLEDWYYLKDAHGSINRTLQLQNIDVYQLASHEAYANDLLQKEMMQRARTLEKNTAFQSPVLVATPDGSEQLAVRRLSVETAFPWPRTFELWIQPEIKIYLKNK